MSWFQRGVMREAAVHDWHAPDEAISRYVAGDAGRPGGPPGDALGPDELWSLEAHLETCASCRGRLAARVSVGSPDTVSLLDRVCGGLDAALPGMPQAPAGRRLLGHWMAPAALPWLATVAAVLVAAAVLAVFAGGGRVLPLPLLLLAPLVPLLGVAASWGRAMDPAYEVVAATARAGLDLVLRRTLAVLTVVLPPLAAVGWMSDTAPARWLLPCLAFTACTLALGDLVGVHRAAAGVASLWAAAVIAPALVSQQLPLVLRSASLPGWALLGLVGAAVVLSRRNAYRYLAGPS